MNDQNRALAVYANKEDVKDLATRIQNTLPVMPGAKGLDGGESLALAQIALAHGLDPFNGEVWHLKNKQGQSLGIMVGIKGLRKSARRESARDDSTYWIDFIRVEPSKYDEIEPTVVWECQLRDTTTVQAYAKSIHEMTDAGIPYGEAQSMLGGAPVSIGVGIATPSEHSKMKIHARARKRAEADAIKMRYGVEFVGASFSADESTIIEGKFKDPEPEYIPPTTGENRSEAEILADLGVENDDQDQKKMDI